LRNDIIKSRSFENLSQFYIASIKLGHNDDIKKYFPKLLTLADYGSQMFSLALYETFK